MTVKVEKLHSNNETSNSKQIAMLKKHFPQCFDKNGNYLPEKMLAIIDNSGIDFKKEFYSLNWIGKNYGQLLANLPPSTLLSEDVSHNTKEVNVRSNNLLIEGDNLEALKHMLNAYTGKIRMIYIDPPYNTGSDGFAYSDKYNFSPEELSKLAGIDLAEAKKVIDLTSKGDNSHSAWLTFIYPRLFIAKELLSEDGVIYISIDDNEQAQLKILCDEIFGPQSFAGMFPWRKRTAKSDVEFGVSQDYEWILCYAQPKFQAGETIERKYHYTDDFPNDGWRTSDLTKQTSASERANSAFDLVNPKNGEVFPFNPNRTWSITKDTFPKYYEAGKIIFPGDYDFLKNKKPVFRVFESEDRKKALKKFGSEKPMRAISTHLPKDVGMTEDGNKQIVELFGQKIFPFPKPINLLYYLIAYSTNENDIVLDFFAGSGTTAHAVLKLNSENGENRQFITIQLPEKPKKNSAADRAGYTNIFDLTKDRIFKAAESLKKDNSDYKGDLSFKIFRVIPEFRQEISENERGPLLEQDFFVETELTPEQNHDLLTTWKLHDGSMFTSSTKIIDLDGYEAYMIDNRLYLLNTGFSSETTQHLINKIDQDKNFNPNKIYIYGNALDSIRQIELNNAISKYANKKSLEIDLLVRY